MTLSAFHNKLSQNVRLLEPNALMAEVLDERSAEATELNRQQLQEGLKGNGLNLGTYRPFTIKKRQERGLQTNFVDLKFTGEYQKAKKLLIQGNSFSFPSNDWKQDMLADRYGDEIDDLTADKKQEFMRDYGHRDAVHLLSEITGIPVK